MVSIYQRLPADIIQFEIIPYLDMTGEFSNFEFKVPNLYENMENSRYFYHDYDEKYEVAICNISGFPIQKAVAYQDKKHMVMLSRKIKDSKYCYYLGFEREDQDFVNCGCGNYECRDANCMLKSIELTYTSICIGKDLNMAIIYWLSIPAESEVPRVTNKSPHIMYNNSIVCGN